MAYQIYYKYQFVLSKNFYFTLLPRINVLFFFLLLQTTKLNLKWLTTLQQDFGQCQGRFERISWSKISFDYLDVKLKLFKKDENKKFRLAKNLTMGEADFNQFRRLRNQLVVAVKDFSKKENIPPVQVKLIAKDMEVQLKLTHKVVEVVD